MSSLLISDGLANHTTVHLLRTKRNASRLWYDCRNREVLMLRAALGAFLVFTPAPVLAQAITAKVIGTVTDPAGAVVPGAAVTLRNQQTSQTRDARTDSLGNYEFPFVPVASYTLAVSAAGFQRVEVSDFALSVDQVARI